MRTTPRSPFAVSFALPLVAALLATACGTPAPPPEQPAPPGPGARETAGAPAALPGASDPREALARAALARYQQRLQDALRGALQRGGPVEALSACRDEAPHVAAGLAADGIAVGRTSHRLRNSDNAPEAWMEPILARYAARFETAASVAVELPGGELGYVEPITVQPVCLACHGAALAPDVEMRLAELYPDDEATGFADGDFRGLFWAVVPPGS